MADAPTDESAYRRLVEPHRPELLAHCYRMLGSAHDAEEALQEALLRAWRGMAKFERRSSLRSWLYRIATNTSLDIIDRRPEKKVLPLDHGPATDPHDGPGAPLVESIWVEPYPDAQLGMADGLASPEARYEQREGVELAFIAVLQHLPPSQRAVLILREVLGFSAREVAATLETTEAAVNSALQRARKAVDELALPEQSQQETLRTLGDDRLREIVEAYADAWERGDVDAVAAMLAEDAVLAMPPMPTWFRGIDDVLVFIRDWAFSGRVYEAIGRRRVKVIPTRANGQIAFGTYSWDIEQETHLPTVLQVLTLRGSEIVEIMGFVEPSAFRRFGLPDEIPA
ncbi:MAG TPA: sigma-70 family RNA polymerase sigma factor [Thermoleophilaceae bacterium]|nr:sigma-70 family RNA polymerase sigma factor [Thermoleophilaceae bacterium]